MSPKTPTTARTEETKPALVPKLRFPEFRGTGEWLLTALDSVCEILNSRRRPITGNERTPGPYPYYGASGIVDKVGDFIFAERLLLVGEDGAKWGAFEKTAFIADGKYWVNNHAHVLKPIAAKDTFLENYLTMLDLSPFVTGAAPPKLTLGKLKGIHIPLPPKPTEQQKIADCLGSLDELIAAQARKVDVLKTHKKGLMQQLFPREDETQPRLRFPDFHGTQGWQKRKVSSLLARSVSPVSVESEQIYREIGIRSHGKGIFHKEPLLGKTLGDKKVFHVEASAFVLNIVFAWEQAVAVTSEAEAGMIASHRFPMYKPNEREADVDFIKYFFLTNKGKELLGIASPGGAGRNKTLGQKEFEKLEFLCPRKVEEQTAIALCLSSADALITVATQKLESLKTHKKGLMQQLFPSAEAVEA